MTGEALLLEMRNLSVQRGGVQVLDIPFFSLQEREVVSLIGPNGAGKSSLLLALACLLPPVTGTLSCRGELIASDKAIFAFRRRLAMVFQEPLLFEGTVFDNVAAGLKIRGMTRENVKSRVMETLEQFNMVHLAQRSARKLSGGEAQRTSLARAFAIRPEMIFLDEPFGALDPPTRNLLTEDLDRILSETATAAVLTTHDQLEALRLSDRMLVVHDGRIVQSGTPVEVLNQPCNEFVATFVGMENVLNGRVIGSSNGLITLTVAHHLLECSGTAAIADTAVVCIRPEHITIDKLNPAGETSARNIFPATIKKIIPSGVFYKLYLDCGFLLIASVTSQSINSLQLEVGKQVFASFKTSAVHLMRSGR